MNEIKISLLPNNYYLKKDGTFDKEQALLDCGRIAGVCYDEEGYEHLINEDIQKTKKRIDLTLNNGHHSVYDQITIGLNIQNIPKILAMVLNNEKFYTTSEKSLRYTSIKSGESAITPLEVELYNKWLTIFKEKIRSMYSNVYNDFKIHKLAQENARYLITVLIPTQMIHTLSFRQINYIASWMIEYINNSKKSNNLERGLVKSMQEFISELNRLNILEPGLMKNEKHRSISLFGKDLSNNDIYYGDTYSTLYYGSMAQYAQAQRHKTTICSLEMLSDRRFFVPPIIKGSDIEEKWLSDINLVKDNYPQGELVLISEKGIYEKFIEKCKERLCSAAQLEIMIQTKNTLEEYYKELVFNNHRLASDMKKYTLGARCTFSDYDSTCDCKFLEGKKLTRKI